MQNVVSTVSVPFFHDHNFCTWKKKAKKLIFPSKKKKNGNSLKEKWRLILKEGFFNKNDDTVEKKTRENDAFSTATLNVYSNFLIANDIWHTFQILKRKEWGVVGDVL